jgi:hydrogenase-4 component B
MSALLSALGLFLVGGLAALLASRSDRLSAVLGLAGLLLGSLAGGAAAVRVLWQHGSVSMRASWNMPMGSLSLGLDPLSAFFLLPILLLSSLAGIYGVSYLKAWRNRKNLGASWFFYNLLVASMVMVLAARNGMLFLVAWEIMALASYFLVVFEDETEEVRRAGRTYLIATHLSAAGLFVLFLLLGSRTGSLDFETFGGSSAGGASAAFLLAVVGFGTKAGLMPFHVWLPEAHPASPSHVSAVMSGVMIKTGIYGLLRTLSFLGPPPPWWGWLLLGIGVSSGILGVLFALAQHDLKRLLAYHSVENMGIIALGIGVGLLGISYGSPVMAYLGFAGALLHVVNHSLFKGLLFLAAGAVAHATHTREIDRLGGVLKRMPWTGALFLIGSAAICGLPPFNGFVSEMLIYMGALRGIVTLGPMGAAGGVITATALALIGGLAAACFAKAFGIVFLGEPRTEVSDRAVEAPWAMRAPMITLAFGCCAIGLVAPLLLPRIHGVVISAMGLPAAPHPGPETGVATLRGVVLGSTAFLLLLGVFVLARRALLASRKVERAVTWDCGYAAPGPRMQYTASGFAQPLTGIFRFALRTRRDSLPPRGLFPAESTLSTHTPDPMHGQVYDPAFAGIERMLSRQRWLQSGQMHFYILYIVVTLILLLIWKLG